MKKKYIIIGIIIFGIVGAIIRIATLSPQDTVQTATVPAADSKGEDIQTDGLQSLKNSLKEKYDIGEPLPVNDDVTGNWRMVTIYSSATPEEYAADYFKAYFETEESTEVHTIINLGLKTTTVIRRLSGKILDITVHEYVDGEETSAKTMGGGMVLQEYSLDTETGETENLLEE